MIDLHSHLVYEVDDGSKSIENSIAMIKEAEKAGFTDIILTPHYMEGYFEAEKEEIAEKIACLREKVQQENIKVNLYQGNEIYIHADIVSFLEENLATTLDDSDYVLFELPMQSMPMNLQEVVYSLLQNKKIPIIAHPERYSFVQENPELVEELIEQGVYFQMNYASILGYYGKEVKKTAKILLKRGYIHFLGTDTHRRDTIYPMVKQAEKKIKKIVGEEEFYLLSEGNAKKVLNNEEI